MAPSRSARSDSSAVNSTRKRRRYRLSGGLAVMGYIYHIQIRVATGSVPDHPGPDPAPIRPRSGSRRRRLAFKAVDIAEDSPRDVARPEASILAARPVAACLNEGGIQRDRYHSARKHAIKAVLDSVH